MRPGQPRAWSGNIDRLKVIAVILGDPDPGHGRAFIEQSAPAVPPDTCAAALPAAIRATAASIGPWACDCGVAGFRAEADLLGMHGRCIRDSHQAEELLQVRLLEVDGLTRPANRRCTVS